MIENFPEITHKGNKLNPLHIAAILNQIEIGRVLLNKLQINSIDMNGHTALMYAIKNHSIEFIQFLLQQSSIDINIQDFILKKNNIF